MSHLPLKFGKSPIFPVKSIGIRPGVYVTVSSGVFQNKQKQQSQIISPVFELSYSRRGDIQGEVNQQLVEVKEGYASLGFAKQASGHSEYQTGSEIKIYSIWVKPETFNHFCYGVSGKSNIDFHMFQKGAYHFNYFKTDFREESVLTRLDECLEKDADKLNNLLLESHILELLSLNLERLLDKELGCEKYMELSKADMERLILAREILLNRLESPPSLLELSRLLQINDCKLKRSFKIYFGKTVYEYVREQRLEKAFSLLTDKHYNVSQSAYAVGYSNISHFSQAFKDRFGISPGKLVSNR